MDENEKRAREALEEFRDIETTAERQLNGTYSPASDAMTALHLTRRLAKLLGDALQEGLDHGL